MEYALVSRSDAPPGGVTAAIDWASADHAVCVVDAAGKVVSRFSVEHTAGGLRTLVQRLARAGVCEAVIERGDGPVVEALLDAGVTVVVITPRQVKNLLSWYGSAGNKDDRFDAYVLADVLRTDRARLRPLTQIKALDTQIAGQLTAHPHGHIFTSLPRSGTVREARLLAEIGDCRARFPDPQSLICLAGAAPSTRQSGKHRAVTFRWAVSREVN